MIYQWIPRPHYESLATIKGDGLVDETLDNLLPHVL